MLETTSKTTAMKTSTDRQKCDAYSCRCKPGT